ncbi:HNH/ENDO VII family nuclease [Solibacillus isronensis]|uniref:HNH/ENDO VII family nuclease n=1 Tax=Solibacillus isronensis TaxID=412383 RepID=UPI00399FF302
MPLIEAILGGAAAEGAKTAVITEGVKMPVIMPDVVYGNLENTMAMPNLEVGNLDKIEAAKIAPEAINIEPIEQYKTVDEALSGASEAEKTIYEEAGLEKTVINNREVLIRTDIDYTAKDQFGRTNLERMEQGLAPLVDGQPVELHHVGQEMDSPLAELTRTEHRGEGNFSALHEAGKESTINRNVFNAEKEAHWKARAEEIKVAGGIS